MKKLFALCALGTMFSFAANAENPVPMHASDAATKKAMTKEDRKEMHKEVNKEMREKKMANASPEQKERMQRHHEMMSKLTSQQKEALQKERARHRQAVKEITGMDFADMWDEKSENTRAEKRELASEYREEHGFADRPANKEEKKKHAMERRGKMKQNSSTTDATTAQ